MTAHPDASPYITGDNEWQAVVDWFRSQPNVVERTGQLIRSAIDAVLDGRHTGRYDYEQLDNVEKTYLGFKVEHLFLSEFRLPKQGPLDTMVHGIPVDIKWSNRRGGWTLPPEAVNQICVLLWADDARSQFGFGIIRIRPEWLRPGRNRDQKTGLRADCLQFVVWLADEAPLPENLLLHLPEHTRRAVLAVPEGQQRVNELFRRVQGRPVSTTVVDTVARQRDASKRVRDARIFLEPEGLIILNGHWKEDRELAAKHGIALLPGYWVSVPKDPPQ